MKNQFLIPMFIGVIALSLPACNKSEMTRAQQINDSLLMVVEARDASLNELVDAFNDVERNLDSVAMRQNVIVVHTLHQVEFNNDQKERINMEIAAINNLMEKNRKKIYELNMKLHTAGINNAAFKKAIATMTSQLAQKNLELTALNEKLNGLNTQVVQLETSVSSLTAENSIQSQTIADETMALHTAYFVVGKSDALQDAKIIDRKGGLLGFGKTAKVSGDYDNSKFTRIDYTQTSTIPVNSDMKIITSHPSDSYTLDKEDSKKDKVKFINITNPEKFWSGSKYLVVMLD